MAHPLQYDRAAQRSGVPPTRARKHRDNGPEALDALTIKTAPQWGHATAYGALLLESGAGQCIGARTDAPTV